MLSIIYNFFIEYLCYFIGGFIQIIFIILPVSLKNWEDDLLNSLTYIGAQTLLAGTVFIIAPWVLEFTMLSIWFQIVLVFGTGIVALFRVIKLIPFEFTFTVKLASTTSKNIEFSNFYTSDRRKLLAELNFANYDSELRYFNFRERLLRIKNDKVVTEEEEDDLSAFDL